jgi:hypothetical protein
VLLALFLTNFLIPLAALPAVPRTVTVPPKKEPLATVKGISGGCEIDILSVFTPFRDGENGSIDEQLLAGEKLWTITPTVKSFTLTANPRQPTHSQRCTIDWLLKIPRGYRLGRLTSSLQGDFTLSRMGLIRITISHGIGALPKFRKTRILSIASGSAPSGSLTAHDFGDIVSIQELPQEFTKCGAEIPFESSFFASLTQPTLDQSGPTRIHLGGSHQSHVDPSLPALPEKCSKDICMSSIELTPCDGENQ